MKIIILVVAGIIIVVLAKLLKKSYKAQDAKSITMKMYANSEVFICTGVEWVTDGEVQIYGEIMKSELRSGDTLKIQSEKRVIKDVYGDEVVLDMPSEVASPGLDIAITFTYSEEDVLWEKLNDEIKQKGFSVLEILHTIGSN